LIESALRIMMIAHEGQIRKYNKMPYYVHPLEVANTMFQHDTGQLGYSLGLLHDAIEDCVELDTTRLIKELVYDGVSPFDAKILASGVESLSNIDHTDYNEKLNRAAYLPQLTKLADIRSNTIRSGEYKTKEKLKKYARKKLQNVKVLTKIETNHPLRLEVIEILQGHLN